MTSVRDLRLDSDVEVEGEALTAVHDPDELSEMQVIGQAMWYTIGDEFFVPRDWLMAEMESLDLPVYRPGSEKTWMCPSKVTPKRAFTRVRNYLFVEHEEEIEVEINGRVRTLELEVKKGEHSGVFHLIGHAFFEAEEIDASLDDDADGEWRHETLGVFRYNAEAKTMHSSAKVGAESDLRATWEHYDDAAHRLFHEMQESHVGKDFQRMMRDFVSYWTTSVKLRDGGAVYFVPAKHVDTLRSVTELMSRIDEVHKKRGRACEIHRIKVTNAAEERKMVEQRAKAHMEQEVNTALAAAIETYEDKLEAGDDDLVESVVESLEDRLVDSSDFASEYNSLTEARLDVESVVRSWMNERQTSGEKEEIIEKALAEVEG